MKKLLTIVVVAVAMLVVLSVAKDFIIKVSVEKGVQAVTGLRLKIAGLKVGIIGTFVDIKGLELFNPPDFKDKMMFDMPEVYVDYDLPAILGGRIHLNKVRLEMKEFTVVKNEKGELNLDSLKVVQSERQGKKPSGGDKAKEFKIQIDSLRLKIGRVVYKDYSAGGAPMVRAYDLNIDESYSDIENAYSLVSLIVVRSLMNTAISNLSGFNLQELESTLSSPLNSAQKIAANAMQNAGKVTGSAQDIVKDTTKEIEDIFKNPFGSK